VPQIIETVAIAASAESFALAVRGSGRRLTFAMVQKSQGPLQALLLAGIPICY
jgi:hypothetical protein